ncbi:ACT domain-containing protein [Candidatus Enterococcus ferrettii]|uniref:CASTOR ACT domain-containing protein n=1 Tax=Candidatus Enterococcus ferrettii TaxID=2815324 RepID=A0ABV0EYB6_9ENTE|nr:ACT domain-containing protein [Enterococcus sp. 665A]MBO1338660.1 ACT domain-containing protein [Enterococcus sp. 665A]
MELVVMTEELSVFQVSNLNQIDLSIRPLFIGATDEENSVVAPTKTVPEETIQREDDWRGFKIEGVLDFALVGILAKITGILAEEKISVFALSTYNTDYVLIKRNDFDTALKVLATNGYKIKTSEA